MPTGRLHSPHASRVEGPGPSLLEQEGRRLAVALGLDDVVQTLCFHACWLHHAANESDRSRDSGRTPFVTILETIARDPERFGVARPAQ